MQTRLPVAGFLLGAALAAALPAGAINILVNPSFETPEVGNFFTTFGPGTTIGSGWVVQSSDYVADVIGGGYGDSFWPEPTDGDQFLYVADSYFSSTIRQDVFLGAGTYGLSFDMAELAAVSGHGLRLDMTPAAGGGSLLGGEQFFSRVGGAGFSPSALAFSVSTPGTYRLSFTSESGHGVTLDNFVLTSTGVPNTGVPDGGGTLALLGLAALGLLGVQRHRNAAG